MDLEKEMEMYGTFQGEANQPPATIGSLISAGLCECIYGIQPEQPERTQYRIPRATENPAVHRSMLRRWIKNFHEMNGMKLPKGFYERDKRQLRGMYYGMLEEYDISIEDIIRSRH